MRFGRRPLPDVGKPLAERLAWIASDPVEPGEAEAVDTVIGTVFVHAHDEVMTPFIRGHKTWEHDEAAWIERVLPHGGTMVDVGANLGFFARLAAQRVGPGGRVFAVEPEQRNLRLLRLNTWEYDNVEIIAAAAWHERTVLQLRYNEANRGDHQVHQHVDAGATPAVALPLDELLGGVPVDVIKIDTQGADHHVLAGLRGTLAANPAAVVLVEFWLDAMDERQESAAAVLDGYRQFGRPISLLGAGGESTEQGDEQILAAADAAPGRFVNLVLGAR